MVKECRPKNEIKFDVLVMRKWLDEYSGNEPVTILHDICGQDLADIVESATKKPGIEIHIQRSAR